MYLLNICHLLSMKCYYVSKEKKRNYNKKLKHLLIKSL